MKHLKIEPYTKEAEQQVIELWVACNLTKPWNDPVVVLGKRLVNDAQ